LNEPNGEFFENGDEISLSKKQDVSRPAEYTLCKIPPSLSHFTKEEKERQRMERARRENKEEIDLFCMRYLLAVFHSLPVSEGLDVCVFNGH
jgi:hypothetical protein